VNVLNGIVVAGTHQTIIPAPQKARVNEIGGPKYALFGSYERGHLLQ
jgi:hypothetical protein